MPQRQRGSSCAASRMITDDWRSTQLRPTVLDDWRFVRRAIQASAPPAVCGVSTFLCDYQPAWCISYYRSIWRSAIEAYRPARTLTMRSRSVYLFSCRVGYMASRCPLFIHGARSPCYCRNSGTQVSPARLRATSARTPRPSSYHCLLCVRLAARG